MYSHRWFLGVFTALAAVALVPEGASAQVPHLAGGAAGLLGNPASAAAMAQAHHAQVIKLFDLHGNGVLDPSEIALAKSGLGHLLGHNGAGATAGGGGSQNFLHLFDQNGNGQLEVAEMQLAQMMFATLAGYSRPVSGVSPYVMPDQVPQVAPPSKGRKRRAQRVADFAKQNNAAAGQKPPAKPRKPANPKKNVKARGPMIEGEKAPLGNAVERP